MSTSQIPATSPPGTASLSDLDVERLRKEFPALHVRARGRSLVYLDNAATSQKPNAVIDAITHYYTSENANVHRGVHYLSEVATERYECARKRIQQFFNAPLTCEIIFTRGATEGINLVAHGYGRRFVGPGDEILITGLEHHSNIVPWQLLCEEKGASLKVAPILDNGEVDLAAYEALLGPRTKLVALAHVSNALGTVNPVREMVDMAHACGAPVLVDGAQSAPHMPVDVRALDCDFFVCSGHKMCGPTGIGVLYGKADRLNAMMPYQGGGDMILSVTFEKTVFNGLPYKFEAGTPHIAGAVGLGAAVDYLRDLGMDRILRYEDDLLEYGTRLLSGIPGVRIVGTAPHKTSVLSFTMDSAHPHDIGQVLSDEGVAIRAGHHCAQPVMQRFGLPATARASLAFYNTRHDLDALARAVQKVNEVFA